MTDGGKVGVDVVPDFTGFGRLFNSGIRSSLVQAQNLGKEAGKTLGGGLRAGLILGTAAAGIAIVDFVRGGVREYGRLADSTRALQRLTGATAQDASLFGGVLRHVGVDADGASRGLGIFAANMAKNPALFAKYNIEIAKTARGNNDVLGTLDNLRKGFSATSDATTRDAIAKQLLGRSYQTLLPYLSLTNDRLALFQRLTRQSGQVLNQADVDKARELKIQMQELTDKVEKLKVSAGRAGTGALSTFATGLSLVSKIGLGDIPRALGSALGIGELPKHIRDAQAAEDGLARSAAEATLSLQEQALVLEQNDTALKGITTAAQGVRSAQLGVQHASEGVRQAERGVASARENTQRATEQRTKAEADLNKLLEKGAVDAQAVHDAERSLEDAKRSSRDATEALTAAEEHLEEVRQGATADDLADAQLRLRSADIALKEAKLAQAQPGNPNDPYAGQQAKLNVDQATQARKAAAEQLATVQQKGTSSDKDLADAEKQVRDASEGVTSATESEADARSKLAEAQAGDPDFQQKVADAKQAVADASRAVSDAQQGERDAATQLKDAQEGLQEANYQLRDAQYALDDAFQRAADDGADLKGVLDELIQKYPELTGVVRDYNTEAAIAAANAAVQPRIDLNRPGQAGISTANTPGARSGGTNLPDLSPAPHGAGVPNLSPAGTPLRDTVSVAPPGRFSGFNATGKNETLVNADLLSQGIDYDQLSRAMVAALKAAGMGTVVLDSGKLISVVDRGLHDRKPR